MSDTAVFSANDVGSLHCRLHRGRDGRRQVDAHDRLGASVQAPPEGLFEASGRRRRGLRQFLGGRHPLVEVLHRDLLAVDELVGSETDEQRDDLHIEPAEFGVAEVAGTVGDDANGHVGSSYRW